LSKEQLDKLRIVVIGSSVGNVPQNLRSHVIKIPREFIQLSGNRNDVIHRACLSLLETFTKEPSLMKESVEEIQKRYTGKHKELVYKNAVNVELNVTQNHAALMALEDIRGSLEKVSSKTPTGDDATLLEYITIFVQVLKQKKPDAKFTCKELIAWIRKYCSTLQVTAPSRLDNSTKTAHFLAIQANNVGLEKIKIEGVSTTIYQLYKEEVNVRQYK
jgi:hypothetical protein